MHVFYLVKILDTTGPPDAGLNRGGGGERIKRAQISFFRNVSKCQEWYRFLWQFRNL